MHKTRWGPVSHPRYHNGFSLVELIAVMLIAAVVAVVGLSRGLPSATLQLQSSRDLVITSLLLAQQNAMVQSAPVALVVGVDELDIRRDRNLDNHFETSESIGGGALSYPVRLPGGVQISLAEVRFDHAGFTEPTEITLSKGRRSLVVDVSGAGYAR